MNSCIEISKKNMDVEIKKSGFYKISFIEEVNYVKFLINKNVNCQFFVENSINFSLQYDIEIDDSSYVEFVMLNKVSAGELSLLSTLNTNSDFNMYIVDLSSKSTSNFECNLNGTHATAKINSTSIIKSNNETEIQINVNHNKPETFSNCLSRAVIYQDGVYNNKTVGFIAKHMNNSKCHQSTKAIVLDETAVAQCDPILLIDEYDVEASHAAAVGQINPDELYYLQSRGLNYQECVRLLLKGFVTGVIEDVQTEEVRESLISELVSSLEV